MIDPQHLFSLEQKYGLPKGLLNAVMMQESGGNPNAVSPKGAQGAFQFMPDTAKAYQIDPLDPMQAADGAARMYADLSKQYQGDLPSMLAAYNWGSGNLDKFGMQKAPAETQNYIQKITSSLPQYAQAETATDALPEGFVLDDFGALPHDFVLDSANKEESLTETAKQGFAQGATFGFSDEAQSALASLVLTAMNDKPLKQNYLESMSVAKERQQRQREQNPKTALASEILGAVGTGGVGATTKTGAAIGNSLRSGPLWMRAAKGAAAGATSGGLYGFGTADPGNRTEGAKQGAKFGAAVGTAIPVVSATARGVADSVIPKIEESIRPLAQRAKELGIPLRLDQLSPTRARRTVQKVSQELPFSGVDKFETTQRQAFNKALARTIGQEADDLGPDTINTFLEDAQNKFGNVLTGEKIKIGRSELNKIGDIAKESDEILTSDVAAVVKKNVQKFLKDSKEVFGRGREIDGEKIASLRSSIVEKLPSLPPGAKQQVGKIIDVLDEAIEGQISPEKSAILKQARREWRNFKTLEPLLEKSTEGTINPTELLSLVKSNKYINASRSAVGQDDLVDLARIGKQFLPKQGGSDTFQKMGTFGLGAASVTSLPLTGTGLAANRMFQSLYNQSPALANMSLRRGALPMLSVPTSTSGVLGSELRKLTE